MGEVRLKISIDYLCCLSIKRGKSPAKEYLPKCSRVIQLLPTHGSRRVYLGMNWLFATGELDRSGVWTAGGRNMEKNEQAIIAENYYCHWRIVCLTDFCEYQIKSIVCGWSGLPKFDSVKGLEPAVSKQFSPFHFYWNDELRLFGAQEGPARKTPHMKCGRLSVGCVCFRAQKAFIFIVRLRNLRRRGCAASFIFGSPTGKI